MVHRKTSKRKTRRRKHRGGYYGAVGAIAPGAMEWGRASEMGQWANDMSSRGGNGKVQYGGDDSPTRKAVKPPSGKPTNKGGKRRSSRRKHRGGGKFGGVSASFQGTGERGLANYGGVITRGQIGTAAGGAFNDMAAPAYAGGTSYVRI